MASLLGLLRANPQHPVGDDGRMALSDHFRELRARLLRAVVVVVVAIIIALFFYSQIFDLVAAPYKEASRQLKEGVTSELTFNGVGAGLSIQLKLCSLVAVIVTSPYWLYQIWAFILPGLHAHERKWTRLFVAVAGPLFIAGVLLGYYVLPKGLQVLINFTQSDVVNLVDFNDFITFTSRMLLVFGIAFEIPLFVVLLNLVGVLPGRVLGRYRPWIIIGVFVFAAVATPSTDPISMTLLALPMLVLFAISEVVARTVDRARGRRAELAPSPDEASPLP
ncbi:Sec-independent protein translocase protein TatC [Marmoricola endophyticus]|uniref:Sec-independent protein translocase protein TatC n=1 Tax=Marmoricola endophyticus TaxID=2040280 RepID=A0A917EZR1_9ACTN|nr:twin-arginine translocase subunit TatC [Marmoricola endophyticus]GGF34391.1 Sec-independent protein translocase protein TatC [Marmoricola endophyticus]